MLGVVLGRFGVGAFCRALGGRGRRAVRRVVSGVNESVGGRQTSVPSRARAAFFSLVSLSSPPNGTTEVGGEGV